MKNYIALIHKEENSAFGVSFPDFPGCITAGDTIDEAARMAAESLGGHIETMREFGDEIPPPSTLDTILADRENADAAAVIIVATDAAPTKIVRANISIPEDVLSSIDAAAKARGMNRSKFLIDAAQRVIGE